MSSEYNSVLSETGHNVQDDAATNVMAGWIDKSLMSGVQQELHTNYGLRLEFPEIKDLMEEHGIDFGYEGHYTVADLIWDSLQKN